MMQKNIFVLLLLWATGFTFGQNYRFVVVPSSFNFTEAPNQYNLNELSKFLIQKKGIVAFFDTDSKSNDFELADRCDILYLSLQKENSFLNTKLRLSLRDCQGQIIAESIGKSKEKGYKAAYHYALREAFDLLHIPQKTQKTEQQLNDNQTEPLLIARKTEQGYDLYNSENIKVYTLFNSSKEGQFILSGGQINGMIYKSETNGLWILEYLKEGKIIQETLRISL